VIRASWLETKGMIVFQMRSSVHGDTPINLFVSEPFDFDVEFARALVAPIAPGVSMRFASIDALISMKRLAGRPKDLEDIRQLEQLRQGGPHDD
jgi:hypothetical protein